MTSYDTPMRARRDALQRRRTGRQPELVFGLIGALGADIQRVIDYLKINLQTVGYSVPDPIKLSALMHEIPGAPFDSLYPTGRRADVEKYMDAGTELRRRLQRGDALAMYAVSALRELRKTLTTGDEGLADRTAFVLDSLKHDEEVETLRRLYGPAFIAVGVYTPYPQRLVNVEDRIYEHGGRRGDLKDYRTRANALIDKDFDEQEQPFGQHVSDAFALADVVISTSGDRLKKDVERFIKLLFGDWTNTPSRDEVAMYHAQAAAFQSSSMARQVGAALCRADGTLIATGTNEVPRYGGGIFDADDAAQLKPGEKDVRDFASKLDSSDAHRRELLVDILERLGSLGLLKGKLNNCNHSEKADELLYGDKPVMKRAKFMATIDYVRTMHAEASVFSNCARQGAATQDSTLYVTTFPCHDCTKQIISNGVKRVVYIEPYTKSLAMRFYEDQIAIDEPGKRKRVRFEPFVGVAPRRYAEFFAMQGNRKDRFGHTEEWNKDVAVPKLPEYFALSSGRIAGERVEFAAFKEVLEKRLPVRTYPRNPQSQNRRRGRK